MDGFEKIDMNLVDFDLPDVFLWTKRADKIGTSTTANIDAIISELVKGMLSYRY